MRGKGYGQVMSEADPSSWTEVAVSWIRVRAQTWVGPARVRAPEGFVSVITSYTPGGTALMSMYWVGVSYVYSSAQPGDTPMAIVARLRSMSLGTLEAGSPRETLGS